MPPRQNHGPPLFTPPDYSDELSEGLTRPSLRTASNGIDWKAPISVRVISIADRTCAPLTTSTVKKAIDYMNSAGGSGGLKYRFYRHDVYPLLRDKRKDLVKWEDLKPIALPMGIPGRREMRLLRLWQRPLVVPPVT